MSKTVKNSLIIIAIVIVLFGIIWIIYDMLKKEPANNTVDTNLVDENTGLDNFINDLIINDITNEEIENKIENEVASNETTNTNKTTNTVKNTVSGNNTSNVTSKKEKAIELVKNQWGGSEGVYFSNDSIDTEGRYIVSVHDKKTTNTLAFFVVNVNTGEVIKQ